MDMRYFWSMGSQIFYAFCAILFFTCFLACFTIRNERFEDSPVAPRRLRSHEILNYVGVIHSIRVNNTSLAPPVVEQRNVVALLVKNNDRAVPNIKRQISMVDAYLQDNAVAEVVIFHDGYFFRAEIDDIRLNTKRVVEFVNVEPVMYRMPSFSYFDAYTTDPTWSKHSKWGYHQMIRFWFADVFDLPTMKNVDYYMRLDDDSEILAPMMNVFEIMRANKAVYMANTRRTEVTEDALPGMLKLPALAREYVRNNSIVPKNPKEWSEAFPPGTVHTFDNNFEVAQVAFFRRPEVKQWTQAVLTTAGIFKYRWGDAALRYLTLALFATKEEVLNRRNFNIKYCHPRGSSSCRKQKSQKKGVNSFSLSSLFGGS